MDAEALLKMIKAHIKKAQTSDVSFSHSRTFAGLLCVYVTVTVSLMILGKTFALSKKGSQCC